MARYIALLRGINVGGNVLRMQRLIELFAELGFKNTNTYLQSGNAVFDTNIPAKKLAGTIQKKLIGETRLPVTVILRTAAELQKTIPSNPFLAEPKMDRSKLHVTFLSAVPSEESAAKLLLLKSGRDRLRILDREIYLHCPDGYGRSKLTNNAIEKCLTVSATTRNWNTLTALRARDPITSPFSFRAIILFFGLAHHDREKIVAGLVVFFADSFLQSSGPAHCNGLRSEISPTYLN